MDEIIFNFFNMEVLAQAYPMLLGGLWMTVQLCLVVVPLGLAAGLGVATLYSFRVPGLNPVLISYIDFFRSFPPLVLLIFVYNSLPFVGLDIGGFASVVLALGLNSSSYYGEIFRAGIVSIPKGQHEAARASGLSLGQSMVYVVLPQAIRNVIPPLTSNTLELVKATSLASVVALPELLRMARVAQGNFYNATPLIAAAVIYFVLLWPLVRITSRLERQMVSSK